MHDSNRIWWRLPQARVLFNSSYHSCSPSSRKDIIQRLTMHFNRCTESLCTCNLDAYLDTLRRAQVDTAVRPSTELSIIAQLSKASVNSGASRPSKTTAKMIDRVPDNSNHNYHLNLRVTEQTDIPGAGNGVTIIRGVPRGTILGLYLNHPNLPRVTKDRIYNPNNTSMYAVEFNGLYRDAYDPISQTISSLVACFNDPIKLL